MSNLPESNAELVVADSGGIDYDKLASQERFMQRLNITPNEKEVKVNKHAGNSMYLPISFIETTLDEMFFGEWHTENFNFLVIANEIVGSIDLVVVNPVTGRNIRRTGAASVMIQLTKGSEVLDSSNKIKNTLVKDFPHLKSSCLSNAARSLGRIFGRDLNREFDDIYQPMILPSIIAKEKKLTLRIDDVLDISELEKLFLENQKEILKSTVIVNAYNKKKKELKQKTVL